MDVDIWKHKLPRGDTDQLYRLYNNLKAKKYYPSVGIQGKPEIK